MDNEPRWMTFEDVVETHRDQIRRFGGAPGIRDEHLIRSATDKPRNSFLYGEEHDVLTLAVELGIAIARNHGFVDGNKRTGAVSLIGFLIMNGYDLLMPDDTLLGRMIEAVLTYEMTEEQLADHLFHYVVELR